MYIVFIATEVHPAVPGGAGTVVSEVGHRLVRAGHRVELLVVGNRPDGAGDSDLPVTWVEPGQPDRAAPDQHRAASRSAAEALAGLAEPPDLVEFQDFHGLAYWALMRRGELGLSQTPIVVRAHGPLDLILQRAGSDRYPVMRAMERHAYRMADAVIAPSQAVADLIADRFGLEAERIRVGEPPVPDIVRHPRHPANAPEIVGYGRLGQEKGSEDLLRAALPLLEADPEAVLRFIGPDGWDLATGSSITTHLQTLIPAHLVDQVRFEGPIQRHRLGESLTSAWMAVFPSRFESFCLAGHECRALGVPIVVPQLPEFLPYFSYRTGAMVYDGTVGDLRRAMGELVQHPNMRLAMEAAPLPVYSDPLAPYHPVTPRHPRTQAGLGTTALRRVEAAAQPAQLALSTASELAARLFDALPESLASRLEDRPIDTPEYRRWRRQRTAGEWERQHMSGLWEGHYPEVNEPEVSVVIPCFNQGEFLHAAIRSVFRQRFDSWEILIVDDGSTDPHTKAVLRALHYPRTRIIRQRNRGLPSARNSGMRAARGRYLVPLDADDELGPGFLTATIDALERHPGAAFAHTWTRLFGNQNLVWIDRPYNPYQLILSTSIVGCALIRSDAWHEVGGYNPALRRGNEDWDLWMRFLENGWGQVEVARPLFRYRQHGISMSSSTEARFEDARLEMARAHPSLYNQQAVERLKAEWYPWVSVVVDFDADLGLLEAQTLDDLEVVVAGPTSPPVAEMCRRRGWPARSGGATFASAVDAARGKFLIDWRHLTEAGPDLLEELANLLEDDMDAYASAVEAGRHPTLWRRWSLLDPQAGPDRLAKAGTIGSGPALVEADYLGAFPHPRWAIDPAGFSRRVHRVRPEVEGRFPEWLP